jgi:DNA (cytosine-5)-methyltransferase 1
MSAYYNENNSKAAAWLRELIKDGHIAAGDVDERSIEDVVPADIAGYTQCHFFAGIGGWSYALRLAGWPDERAVWTGSCPCQPFSAAGKQRGFADERHLWPAWDWLIGQCRPNIIFGEQVTNNGDWLDLISGDLEGKDYAFGAAVLGAHSDGLPHVRQRFYWLAEAANYYRGGRQGIGRVTGPLPEFTGLVPPALSVTSPSGPYLLSDDGVSNSMGLLRGFGNAIVPQVAAAFIEAYSNHV